MKFFKDINTGTIVRVNSSSGVAILEMFQEGMWKDCSPDSSYAREYWLGEGNNCLFEIDQKTAMDEINKQA